MTNNIEQKLPMAFLQGEKTILRPPDKLTDLAFFYRWINDPEVIRYLTFFTPTSLKREEDWIDSLNKDSNSVVFTITTLEGQPIGIMSIDKIDWKNRRAITGALIGEKDYWGKGYGRDAKMLLLEYIFNTLNLHKVTSTAIDFNDRSIRYNKACGYKVEGRLKKHDFRDGEYRDVVQLAVFRDDWLKKWKNIKSLNAQ